MITTERPAPVEPDGYDGLPAGSGFDHRAVVCATPDDLGREAADWLRRGLAADRTVLAVLRDEVVGDVRARLGDDAARVRFLHHAEVYAQDTGPLHDAQRARLEHLTAGGEPVTAVSQHDPGADETWDDPLGVRCLEGEVRAAIDYARLPLHQVCLYPAFRHRRLLAIAHRTHATVTDAVGERASRRYRTPAALAASHPALSHLDRHATVHDVRPDTDPDVCGWLAGEARRGGVSGARAEVLAHAAHEAMLATVRGLAGRGRPAPSARCYLHRTEDGFAVDVDAAAFGPLPRTRLPTDALFTYLWFAQQNSDDVSVRVHALDDDHSRIRVLAVVD